MIWNSQSEVKKIELRKKLETFWNSFLRHIRWREALKKMISLSCHFWMKSSKNGVVFFATFAHGEMRTKDFETRFWGVRLDVKSSVTTLLRAPNLFYFLKKTTFCGGGRTFWTVFTYFVRYNLLPKKSTHVDQNSKCESMNSQLSIAIFRAPRDLLVAQNDCI